MQFYRGKPLESLDELFELYATSERSQIPILAKLDQATEFISSLVKDNPPYGVVVSIEGGWGSGKTSFVNLLEEQLGRDLNVSFIRFDSLYYGNVSEATTILMEKLLGTLTQDFGVRIKNGFDLAKNITPEFELSNGLPKFTLRYGKERKSTEEILRRELNHKTKGINGRVILVLDDIDRLPSKDALHFLRIVRVLRELSSVLVILPVDRANLEELIGAEGIAKPTAYLQKVIDKSFNLDPDQATGRQLFDRLIARKYEVPIPSEVVDLVWNLVLWELSISVIQRYERSGGGRFTMGAGANDPNQWSLLEPISQPDGTNLVRRFIEQTSPDYGGSGYFVRISDHQNNRTIFRSYKAVSSSATFTELIRGTFIEALNPQAEDLLNFGRGNTMMEAQWWRDDGIRNALGHAPSGEYVVENSGTENEVAEREARIKASQTFMWDDVARLVSESLPPEAAQLLSARTLNRIVENLSVDPGMPLQGPDRAVLQKHVKSIVSTEVDFIRNE